MRIAIDISQAVYGGGVSVYTKNLLAALLAIDNNNDYRLFFSSLRRKLDWRPETYNHSRVKLRKFRMPPSLLDLLWNRWHIPPLEFFVGSVDVFHASDWTQPPAREAKLVTTIHDLSFLRWPETVNPKVLAVQKRRLRWVKREADAIIAVSEATKKEIVELLKINPRKIKVIYEAVPQDVEQFLEGQKKLGGKEANKALEATKKRYGIGKSYFFCYGSMAPRKNIDRIVGAFARAQGVSKSYQLVISGDYRSEKELPETTILTGFLSRQEMLAIFAGAEGLLYPSLYEGFGLPILEAFSLGVPVITGNVSSMAEIAGKAAILVNPESGDEITEAIRRIINEPKLKERLVELGRQRAKEFSWRRAAKETLAVYQGLVEK